MQSVSFIFFFIFFFFYVSPRLILRNRPRENPDIIHKALDDFFILVFWVAGPCEVALPSDLCGRELDFEFVVKVLRGLLSNRPCVSARSWKVYK